MSSIFNPHKRRASVAKEKEKDKDKKRERKGSQSEDERKENEKKEMEFLSKNYTSDFVKYKLDNQPGELITCSECIKLVMKNVSTASERAGDTLEKFLDSVRNRTMTEENKSHFKMVVAEMLSTEKIHLTGLDILNTVFLEPMKKVGSDEAKSVASNVQGSINIVVQLHTKFRSIMEESFKDLSPEGLPLFNTQFSKQLSLLKMGSSYMTKYTQYLEQTTNILKKEKDVVKAQNKAKEDYIAAHSDVNNIQAISFYLILPIQRIPRYELLIRDMLKDAGKDYSGLESLIKAYNDAKESAKASNTLKTQLEEQDKLKFLKGIIKGSLKFGESTTRKFMCCGPMYWIPNLQEPPKELFYYFLFNDILIQTKPKKFHGESVKKQDGDMASWLYSREVDMEMKDLENCQFEVTDEWDVSAGWWIVSIKGSSAVPYPINLLMNNLGLNWKFAVNTEEEKNCWESIIYDQVLARKKTLENLSTRKKHSTTVSTVTPTIRQKFVTIDSEFIKYKVPNNMELVTCGDTIKNVIKSVIATCNSSSDNVVKMKEYVHNRTMTDENKSHFKMVYNEMLSSEKVHYLGFDILDKVYLEPMKNAGSSEAKSVATSIESAIKMLGSVSKNFQALMEEGLKDLTKSGLPQFNAKFTGQLGLLKMGSSYITKYTQYLEQTTNILKKEKDVVKAQDKAKEDYMAAHSDVKNIQAISFYLILPIQRIPRYELLIRDMLKDIGKDYAAMDNLIKAFEVARDSAKASNTLKTQLEEQDKLKAVLSMIDIQLDVLPSRRFLCCGPLYLVVNLVSRPTAQNFFFLFTDRLIGCNVKKMKGKDVKDEKSKEEAMEALCKLNSLDEIIAEQYVFEKVTDTIITEGSGIYAIEDTEKVKNIIHCKLNQIPYKFSCETKEEAEVWNSLLFDQIQRLNHNAKQKQ
ncbi:Rho/RAC guanine nucleotide exchange factor, putative [Entamoeba invadens IP1]|uniref:Rho/RAC guanine nucleotide exchange factor, putative n=1 Tax=Entamoeba invadens IP1 TaxID=370355 RepID=A0A0A1U4P4_ENTIV|nr:Rho/RAC guanine nucleotide exchange factor, putative [Entamoeba invadens IP1]ELP89174.1 Rho/RAC guanine nucleotide exchange factor, putative [Entamoeba invadens IP1]|eukprot:XP_004255945.1 Rho/RAC guanine nucleotide exchange factor, putative [Entamoeba invadens IP1]